MSLCKYSESLGKPGEGLHSYRLFNIAMMDVIGTVIGGYALSYYMDYSPISTIMLLFLLGIFLHRIFCVKTTVDTFLFGVSYNKT
jgi:hypothetical protein